MKKLLLGFTLAGFCLTAWSQEGMQKIQQQFNTFATANPQEKLFVHTDKEVYLVGEIIWFKLYADRNTLLSSIAYVDVLDAGNKSVLGTKVSLKESEDNGSALIPLSVNTGNYKLRAYTNWMKNDAEASFFEKSITIINPFKNPDPAGRGASGEYEVTFFPEGGNLVKGIESKVAFRITGNNGKGIAASGRILNERNESVAGFRTQKFGIGTFTFTPSGKYYKAEIQLDSVKGEFEFPAVADNGYVMNAEDKGAYFQLTVKSSYTSPQYTSIAARVNEQIKHAETVVMNNGNALFSIQKDKLGKGVIQFTVFNGVNQPVCERLVFVRPELSIASATVDGNEFGNRKKVEIDINTKNSAGSAVAANMSLSVVPIDPLQDIGEADIASYFLLSSHLKGQIESPSYYFSAPSAELEQATDNLMLTHGWRRYNWDKVLGRQNNGDKFKAEYDGHTISVLVTDKLSKQPVHDKEVFLSVPGSSFDFMTALTNDHGIATFRVKEIYGPSKIMLQAGDASPAAFNVEVMSPFYGATPGAVEPLNLHGQDSLLEKYSINMQVQNIFNADSMRIFYAREPKDSLLFYGKAMYGYNLDAYTRFTTMEEVLREYVREINVISRNGKLYLRILDEGRKEFNEEDILVLWDGVPVPDPHSIFNFDPLKVKRLEVIPRRFAAGGSIFRGIASFTTYNGDLAGYNPPAGIHNTDYEGMQLQREFYSPTYETAKQVNNRMPDFRNTLYWSANVNTTAKGEAKVSFYTGDRKGKYIVVLQGLDENGNPVMTKTTFEVK